jgi:uncharacterized protein YbjT (DUF2867 family)
MILITGASGTIGTEVLRLLALRGIPSRAMTRQPARLRLPARTGVEIVRADFDHPDSLRHAVTGADSVFLLTPPGTSVPDQDLALIQAARASGVRKIVKLSGVGGRQSRQAQILPSSWHEPGERALAASGLAWSTLRPTAFASNALRWADAIQAGEPVPNTTGTGTQGVVDPRDVAAVAVEVLLTDEHDGAAHTLTGPELLSVPDQVAQLTDELGRQIKTVDIPSDAIRPQLLAAGLDPSAADTVVAGYQLIRDGGNAIVTSDVEHILGRPARTFRTWARDHRTFLLPADQRG